MHRLLRAIQRGADGLVKYPRDKVPVVFRGVSEIKNFYCYKHVLEGKIVVLTKGSWWQVVLKFSILIFGHCFMCDASTWRAGTRSNKRFAEKHHITDDDEWGCCRLLEEGKLSEADQEKQRLEQIQREQRKKREEEQASYSPRWFT